MLPIGVQTKNVVEDASPGEGFAMLKRAGFTCCDFSLNGYLPNTLLYRSGAGGRQYGFPGDSFETGRSGGIESGWFFDRSVQELERFFAPHRRGARKAGITVSQMHMPYPIHIPGARENLNEYLWSEVAPKSMGVCAFFECPYIVIHGFKLAYYLGSEEDEWAWTERFIHSLAPMAREMGITICIENLYDGIGGHLVEGPCCDAKKAVERIDRMNDRYHAEVLGFCFDTGHANLAGIDFEHFITELGPRLKVLHIHDNDGIADLHQIPFTFTKTRENKPSTDWEGFVRGLGNIRFDKTLSFETAPVLNAFPDEMKQDALGFIHRIGEHFSGQIER